MNRKIDLKIGFRCNNHCVHCVQGDQKRTLGEKTFVTLQKEINAGARTATSIVFTGGEPTIHPDFLELVRYARSRGFKRIQIQTNGRMFSYMDFSMKTIEAGASEFSPALHGATAKVHDGLTGVPGSFAQTVQGIRNLKSLHQRILTNTVVTRSNFRTLPRIARLLVSLKVDQFQFAFPHPAGSAWDHFQEVVPRMKDALPYIKKGLDIGIAAHVRVMTEAIPYCVMKGYTEYIAESKMPESTVFDADLVIKDYSVYRKTTGKKKQGKCRACCHFDYCEGLWREYPQIMGWDEFEPELNA